MKKIVTILMFFIIGLAIFSGCSSNNNIEENSFNSNTNEKVAETPSEKVETTKSNSVPQPPALPSD